MANNGEGGDVGVAKTACVLTEGEGRRWHGGGGTASCGKGVVVGARVVFQAREGKGAPPVVDACLTFQAREREGHWRGEDEGVVAASCTSSEEEESVVVVGDRLAFRSRPFFKTWAEECWRCSTYLRECHC